eukprot:snap_masked-scaffold_45-processed-gene-1.63-mRNA-1 protein AED:0.18 eAED:1.00 QI:0/-1/0/1/-1/1/1/0/366
MKFILTAVFSLASASVQKSHPFEEQLKTTIKRLLQRNEYTYEEWCDDPVLEACMEVYRETFPGPQVDNYLATFDCGAFGPVIWDMYNCFLDTSVCPGGCEGDLEDAFSVELHEDGLGDDFCGNYFKIDGSPCKYLKAPQPEWIQEDENVPGGYLCDHGRAEVCADETRAIMEETKFQGIASVLGCEFTAPYVYDVEFCYNDLCPAYCLEEDRVDGFQESLEEEFDECSNVADGDICSFVEGSRPQSQCNYEELMECVEIGEAAFGTEELLEQFFNGGINACDVFGPPLHDLYACYEIHCSPLCDVGNATLWLQDTFDASSRTCKGWWGDVCGFIQGPRPLEVASGVHFGVSLVSSLFIAVATVLNN